MRLNISLKNKYAICLRHEFEPIAAFISKKVNYCLNSCVLYPLFCDFEAAGKLNAANEPYETAM